MMSSENESDKYFLAKLKQFRDNPLIFQDNKKKCDELINNLKAELNNIIDKNKKWLYLKTQNFFSEIEEKNNPTLVSTPYVVTIDNIVKAFNESICSNNIKIGINVRDAKKYQKDLVEIKFDPPKYTLELRKIMKMLSNYDKHLEREGYDEFIIDISEFCEKNYASTKEEYLDIISEIISKIKEEFKLSAVCGVGNNKTIAKLACYSLTFQKKDSNKKIIYIENDLKQIEKFLSYVPLGLLTTFFFERTLKKLSLLTIKKLSNIFSLSTEIYYLFPSQHISIFSVALGIGGFSHENIKDIKPLIIQANVTQQCNVFDSIDNISGKLSNDLKKKDLTGKTLSVEITDTENNKISKSLSLIKRFEGEGEIKKNAKNLVKSIISSNININVKSVKLKLSGIIQKNFQKIENIIKSPSKAINFSKLDHFFIDKKQEKEAEKKEQIIKSCRNSTIVSEKINLATLTNKVTQIPQNNLSKIKKNSETITNPSVRSARKSRGRPKTKSHSRMAFKTLDTFFINK